MIQDIQSIIKNSLIKDRYYTKAELKSCLKKSIFDIHTKIILFGDNADPYEKWLLDNRNFILEIKKSLRLKKSRIRIGFKTLLKQIFLLDEFQGEKEEVIHILNEYEKKNEWKESELESLREAFFLALLEQISSSAFQMKSELPHLIQLLHNLNRVDFGRIAMQFSPLERILRLDPSGVYGRMTKTTRHQYRKSIQRSAERKKVSPENYAKDLIKIATKEGKHVGFYLEKEKKTLFYFPLILFFSVLLSFAVFLLTKTILISLFALIVLYFPVKSVVDSFYSKVRPSFVLPTLKCDTVTEEEKTCVVITTLLTSVKEVQELVDKIRKYKINNKSENDELYFGLLCDLTQSKKQVNDQDRLIIEALRDAIDRLNEKDASYFAMIRGRVYHESENAFVGWERKRGAIEEFVRLLVEGKMSDNHTFIGTERIIGAKFLITLDGDTELGIGQAKRLIGKISHPMIRPKVTKNPNGHYYVTQGYGILQPKISSSLLNPITTPFAKIFSNGSGEIPYAGASFDGMQSLFFEGNFCGKGIIDIEAYYKVIPGALPEQRILSHDMPEGAFLRCGIISDEFFLDSDPQTAISNDKRLHRWIRGDIQNLILFSRIIEVRKVFALENLLRYFVPIAEMTLVVISSFISFKVLGMCVGIVLFAELFPALKLAFSFLFSGNFQIFGRRFRTKIRNQLTNVFYICALSFMGIVHRSIFHLDAMIRSCYRMLISKKKLLEWQAFSPFHGGQKDPLTFYLPSLSVSIAFLFLSRTPLMLIISILFLMYPFIMLALSEKYVVTDRLNDRDKKELLKRAKEEFLFFKTTVNENSSYLPPDNIQFEPIEKIANKTSPTNIGLYLVSLVNAVDLKIITEKEGLKRLEKALDSIEKMEHYQGHLFNWYDLATLKVIGDRFISSVDSGNYFASLIVVSAALSEWKSGSSLCKRLKERIENEIGRVNFKVLFDWEANLFFVGIFPDSEMKNHAHYDLFISEMRLTSYLSIAFGQIPPSHWHATQRPILSLKGRVGIGSWSGTCFEYFMPTLFLPIIENSMEDETLDFAYFCQKKYSSLGKKGVFGISESGYCKTDTEGNYQYRAFGVPYLSLSEQISSCKVISPYSSFLMLERGGFQVIQNLKNLKEIGAKGPMGYYEAVEFNDESPDERNVVRSYMAHHKGMSFIALANVLLNHQNVKRFLSRNGFAEKMELLGERFPLEGKIYKKKPIVKVKTRGEISTAKDTFSMQKIANHAFLCSDGKVSLICYDNGTNRILYDSLDIFNPLTGGLHCCIRDLEGKILFHFSNAEGGKIRYGACGIEYIKTHRKKSAVLHLSPLFTKNAIFVRLELNGIPEPCNVEFSFDFQYQKTSEYNVHPAFQNLSLEGSFDGKELVLRRRGVDTHKELLIYSNRAFRTKLSNTERFDCFQNRMLFDPRVLINFSLKSAESCVLPLFLLPEAKGNKIEENVFDASFRLTKQFREISERKARRLADICKTSRHSTEKISELLLISRESRPFYHGVPQRFPKSRLWEFGISGDYPIVAFLLKDAGKTDIERIGHYISAYKKMALGGINEVDFVVLHQEGNGYFNEYRDRLAKLAEGFSCDFLIGKHPGIHFVSFNETDLPFWESVSKKFISKFDRTDFRVLPKADDASDPFEYKADPEEKLVGEFLQDGFMVDKRKYNPEVAFSHILACRNAGFMCNQNSLGFTWYRNAGLNRLSKWDNIPTADDGEKVFLLQNGTYLDLLKRANKVYYLKNAAVYEGEIDGAEYRVTASLLNKIGVKQVSVSLSDPLKRESKIVYSLIPCLGKSPNKNVFVTQKQNMILLNPCFSEEYENTFFLYATNCCSDLKRSRERLLIFIESKNETLIYLGGYSSERHLEFFKKQFEENKRFSNVGFTPSRSDGESFRTSPMNFWLEHQVKASRFHGRTGLYQSSGAYGFRDQLQDSLVFLKTDPQTTKIHLLRCASHQFEEGDVLHWWHTIRKKNTWDPGVRTKTSDDYLWLIYGIDAYVQETGDRSILDITTPFLVGDGLKDQETERYFSARKGESGEIREHLERAVKLFLSRGLGAHNLPDIGCGDWNDGMSRIDGESVWLGFFGAICLNRAKKYVSGELNNEIDKFLGRIKSGLDSSHNGIWFARCFRKNGQVIGNDVSVESECSIDLITQAFSAFYFLEFCGTGFSLDGEMVKKALNAAYDILVDRDHRLIKLFTKPFRSLDPSPGYIQRYCAGVRENGGQYTHAAVWFAIAMLDLGRFLNDEKMLSQARNLTELLDPSKNIEASLFRSYKREPYVLCGDIYDASGFKGHGGWSWYTGAASWYLRLINEIDDKNSDPKNKTGIF